MYAYIRVFTYCKLQHTSQLFKPEKYLYETKGRLIQQSQNPNLYSRLVTRLNSTPNNPYTPLIIPVDCHKHFQLSLKFDEHVLQITSEIIIKY